jgi:hypothetical protein
MHGPDLMLEEEEEANTAKHSQVPPEQGHSMNSVPKHANTLRFWPF